MFSKKAKKFDKIFTVALTLCSKCQTNSEDFVNFCGHLRKHELYIPNLFATATSSNLSRVSDSDNDKNVYEFINIVAYNSFYKISFSFQVSLIGC